MGQHEVDAVQDDRQRRAFMKAVLDDVRALEKMIETGAFESGIRRIGAEQEMFVVDESYRPASLATEILADIDDERITTELARFNLEANLSPLELGGDCLRKLELEMEEVVEIARAAARQHDADVVLTGILPTLRKGDLGLDNMTPIPRYFELNRAMQQLRGSDFHVFIKGIDELELTHDNVMLESCNTSFQIHFQVEPHEFAPLYNLAQLVTAPVLAAAVNSPMLLGNRLWQETRIALFQHSVDTRHGGQKARASRPRVSFGDKWVENSVLEIFREDIARFRVVLGSDVGEDPMAALERGDVPKLPALCLHNGTVYRWNRACYGIGGGVPHLRIENRALPAGPSIRDEVATAALYFGLMSALGDAIGDPRERMAFDLAKNNFFAAARHGLDAQLSWIDGTSVPAGDLLLNELLPVAREGLKGRGLDSSDIDTYLGVVEERVKAQRTGSTWVLESMANMPEDAPHDGRHRALVHHTAINQRENTPVHLWPLAQYDEVRSEAANYLTVGQFMTRKLLTVHPEDLVDLAASVMDWERIRHIPVEDDDGKVVGVVTHRALLRLVAHGRAGGGEPVSVREIMRPDPLTVTPETPTIDALRIMREKSCGCLPVLEEGRLVGIVTEHDLVVVSARLLEEYLQGA